MSKKITGEKVRFLKVIILFCVSFIITINITNIGSYSETIESKEPACFDLSTWNFNKSGVVNFNGKWEFYWQKLYTYDDFISKPIKPDIYAKVPSVWNNYKINKNNLPGFGYATYRIKVRIKDANESLALKVENMSTSYRLYIDDKLEASNGQVSASKENFKPEFRTNIFNFVPGKSEFNIIVQVANYSYARGGMWYSMQMGTSNQINSQAEALKLRNCFLLGGLAVIAIYYLNFFLVRRKDKESLLLVKFCVLAILGIIIYGDFNIFNYEQKVFIDYVLTYLTPLLFFLTIAQILPEKSSEAIIKKSIFIAIFETILVIALPIFIYTRLTYIFEALDAVFIFFAVWIAVKAYIAKKPYSVIILTVCLLVVAGFCNDMLYENNIIFHVYTQMSPVTVFMAIILQAIVLAREFSEAFNQSQELSGELTDALKREIEMREQLVKLDKLKDEFLANTSHELRTPLNGIITIAESMIKGVDGKLNELQKKDLSLVTSSGKRLANLINDILDISKIKNNDIKLYKKSLDLSSSIDSIVKIFEYLNSKENVKILINIPKNIPNIIADEDRFEQIMYNLIGNAIKFTDKGFIKIYAKEEEKTVKIVVEDTGEGIPEEKLEYIWQAFNQLDSSITRKNGGVGLGLYITRHLVELHGGSITVQSKLGHGSSFEFTLPSEEKKLKRIQEEKVFSNINYAKNEAIPENLIRGEDNILLVDDDIVNLHAVMNVFKLDDYSVTPVNSGNKALEKLKTNNYSLIILDVMMPGMSGYEVCQKIRETKTMYELPILMLTAYNRPESAVLALKAGANDFLSKPFDSSELLARVRNLVELKKSVSKALNMEMAFLQAQIEPHFLFNVLNTISELCYENYKLASDLIVELANYLRTSFSFTNLNEFIPLEKELRYINSYIRLQNARFEYKVRVEINIDTHNTIMLPPLIIQPLVENAVGHGIRDSYDSGIVKVTVKETEEEIYINVWDNGKGIEVKKLENLFNTQEDSKSVGLKNINKRLKNIYGTGIKISSKEGIETSVTIIIPNKRMG